MTDDLVKILDGNTFVVCDARGDIEASPSDPTGLFSFDTRFLSRWVLTVNGDRLNALSTDDLQYFETRFFLVPGTGTVYIDAKLSVIRQRAVGDGFSEELTILNHDEAPVDLVVRLDAGCDFADLFEVKDKLEKKGTYYTRTDDEPADPRLRARHVPARDDDLGVDPRSHRRRRPDVHLPDRAARLVVDRADGRDRGRRLGRSAQPRPSTGAASARRARTWNETSRSGSTTRRASNATGSR